MNVPATAMPILTRNCPAALVQAAARAITKHAAAVHSMETLKLPGIYKLDDPIRGLPGSPSIQRLLLDMKTTAGEELLLAVELHWSEPTTKLLVYPRLYRAQAMHAACSVMKQEIEEVKLMLHQFMPTETGGGGTPPVSSGNNHVTPQENETASGGEAG